MPKIKIPGPYRFGFYSNENDEGAHVHVFRENRSAKFWLLPVGCAFNKGFESHELWKIVRLIEANKAILIEAWEQYEERK